MPLPAIAKTVVFHVLRTGFRMLPLPAATRDRMRQRFLDNHYDLVPAGPRGKILVGGSNDHRPRVIAAGRAIGYRSREPGDLPKTLPATLIAFYLPQFHPIPENDAWWGPGFTEWQNVTRALPQFEGHAQPRLPGELGFYDLRIPDVMRQQMQLAREYGVGAFCSYFYWFGGKTLLEQPLQQWLHDSTLDLPLCLCWANENWSRRWDGRADQILIGQQHSAEDDVAFIAHVARYVADERYLRVDGKPLLLVYRPGLLPDPKATALRWRAWCHEHGMGEIYLAYVQSFDRVDPRDIGFDAAVAFPPNNSDLKPISDRQRLLNPSFCGDVYDWRELARSMSEQPDPDYTLFPCVNPGWDNEPRRSGNGRVFVHASPHEYGEWLQKSIAIAQRRKPASPLVFINAWNEWAEGAVLEPDTRLGFAWLEATRRALQKLAAPKIAKSIRPCVVIHTQGEVHDELLSLLQQSGVEWRIIFTTALEEKLALQNRLKDLGIQAEIHASENTGRDILPFLQVADRLLDEDTNVVLKLRADYGDLQVENGPQRQSIAELLSSEQVNLVLEAFRRIPRLGLVAPEECLRPLDLDSVKVDRYDLIDRLGIDSSLLNDHRHCVNGGVFWAKLDALRPLLDEQFGVWEFEGPSDGNDSNLADSIERFIPVVAHAAGYVTKESTSLYAM